jgi:hypothetical protein
VAGGQLVVQGAAVVGVVRAADRRRPRARDFVDQGQGQGLGLGGGRSDARVHGRRHFVHQQVGGCGRVGPAGRCRRGGGAERRLAWKSSSRTGSAGSIQASTWASVGSSGRSAEAPRRREAKASDSGVRYTGEDGVEERVDDAAPLLGGRSGEPVMRSSSAAVGSWRATARSAARRRHWRVQDVSAALPGRGEGASRKRSGTGQIYGNDNQPSRRTSRPDNALLPTRRQSGMGALPGRTLPTRQFTARGGVVGRRSSCADRVG